MAKTLKEYTYDEVTKVRSKDKFRESSTLMGIQWQHNKEGDLVRRVLIMVNGGGVMRAVLVARHRLQGV